MKYIYYKLHIYSMLLSSYVTPHMLIQIIRQLYVGFLITHVTMELEEVLVCCRWTSGYNIVTMILSVLVTEPHRTLGLHDHVVHDHTCIHYLPQSLNTSTSRRVPNNIPSWLEHTKSMLHIFSTTLLFFGKPWSLLSLRVRDFLHKSWPLGINTISEVVSQISVSSSDDSSSVDDSMKLL